MVASFQIIFSFTHTPSTTIHYPFTSYTSIAKDKRKSETYSAIKSLLVIINGIKYSNLLPQSVIA